MQSMESKDKLCQKIGWLVKETYKGCFIDKMRYEKSGRREYCVIFIDNTCRKRIDITGMEGMDIIKRVLKEFE